VAAQRRRTRRRRISGTVIGTWMGQQASAASPLSVMGPRVKGVGLVVGLFVDRTGSVKRVGRERVKSASAAKRTLDGRV
jgi:hypothetical protein